MKLRKIPAGIMIVLMACAALLATPSTASADTGNRDNCRGYVSKWWYSSSTVKMTYRVTCARTQDSIYVSADLTRHVSGLPTKRASKTCLDRSACSVTASISNPPGTQLFTGTVFSANARRNGYDIRCGWAVGQPSITDGIMTCRGSELRV